MSTWWINGQPADHINVADRGFSYADGLFETIAIRDTRTRLLEFHLDRLFAGCQRLRIQPPMSRTSLAAHLQAAAKGLPYGVLKLMITRGTGPRGYAVPPQATPCIIWGIATARFVSPLPVRLRWCETMVSVNRATAGLKTLGRLEQVLARREWTDPAITEGLMTNTSGRLIGGTSSNVFLVMGDRLLTPALHNSGISGVMRRAVLEVARQHGIGAVEADVRPALIGDATELFVTNALTGIRPVARLQDRAWPTGPITQRLQALLKNMGVAECSADC
ncbi:MAG: aminodeoxychorismate lyase [Gammaproteobacteria bacterium]